MSEDHDRRLHADALRYDAGAAVVAELDADAPRWIRRKDA